MKKAISIFLSLLMLASSSGLAYSQHFCGGMEMMAKVTLGDKHLSCGMDTDASDSECNTEQVAHNCCKNHITKIQTDDNFAKASFDLKFNKVFVSILVSPFVMPEVKMASLVKIFFADYNPPPIEQDLNILYDTFLI